MIANYRDAIEYLNNKQSLGIKPGLERIIKCLESLDNPQDKYKTIHIAGTNGKGTVAATLAKSLQKNGYKVGLFTSPWVVDFREQIQVDGEFICEDDLMNLVAELEKMQTDCTEFECLCVVAYMFFAKQNVDFAVVECGMGGKGDATNVEKENLSVITSISLDHTDFLGDTVEKIAEEKSGILRKNCTCVLYDKELADIFKDKCNKLVTTENKDNLSLVNAVLCELGVEPVSELVRLPARQEHKNGVLLDGGHNLAAAKTLSPQISAETAVIGMMKDKDVDGYLSVVAPKCSKIIVTNVNNPRAISARELCVIAKKYCNNVEICENPQDALKYNPTLICGSFYLIREIYNLI